MEITDLSKLDGIMLKGLEGISLKDVLFTINTDNPIGFFQTACRAIKYSFIDRVTDNKGSDNKGSGSIAFLFSNSYSSRKDYPNKFNAVAALFPNSLVITSGRKISFKNVLKLRYFFCWYHELENVFGRSKAIQVVYQLYLAYLDCETICDSIQSNSISKLIVFSDFHPIDAMVVRRCKSLNIKTYTLQHGFFQRGSYAFTQSRSDIFLCFGEYTKKLAVECGLKSENVIPVGMMNQIGKVAKSKMLHSDFKVFSIVCSSCYAEEIKLLRCSEFLLKQGYKRIIKLHPGADLSKYEYEWQKEDSIITNEKNIYDLIHETDFSLIAGGSTVFAEYMLELFPAFLYDPDCSYYIGVDGLRFRDGIELKTLVSKLQDDPSELENTMLKARSYLLETGNVKEKYMKAIGES